MHHRSVWTKVPTVRRSSDAHFFKLAPGGSQWLWTLSAWTGTAQTVLHTPDEQLQQVRMSKNVLLQNVWSKVVKTVIKQIHTRTFTSNILFEQTTFRSGLPQPLSSQKDGATQTKTSMLKLLVYIAGERTRVDLLDDYDFPARTITETSLKLCHLKGLVGQPLYEKIFTDSTQKARFNKNANDENVAWR